MMRAGSRRIQVWSCGLEYPSGREQPVPPDRSPGGRASFFAGPSHLPDDPQPTTAGASQDPDHHQTSAPEKPWPRHSPVSGRRPPVRSLDHVAALRGHASRVIAATTARARLGRPRGRL